MCPENYIDDLPANTRRLLNESFKYIEENIGLEVTFLMNCLLGLIDIVSEKHKDKMEGKSVSDFSKHLPKSFKGHIKENDKKIIEINDSRFKEIRTEYFIRKLRNGICHQHIEAFPKGGKWEYVTIKDFDVGRKNKGSQNFEITLTIEQLKSLAIAISELAPTRKPK